MHYIADGSYVSFAWRLIFIQGLVVKYAYKKEESWGNSVFFAYWNHVYSTYK